MSASNWCVSITYSGIIKIESMDECECTSDEPMTLEQMAPYGNDTDAIRGNLRIEGSSLEEKLMGDPEIADILGKIAGMAGPIIVKGSKAKNDK